MKILFAHNSFLGQFQHFASWLRKNGHEITVLHRHDAKVEPTSYDRIVFQPAFEIDRNTNRVLLEANAAMSNAIGAAQSLLLARDKGYQPDIMLAHCGWGTGLLLKNVWPSVPYVAYHEWFYQNNPENPEEFISKIEGLESERDNPWIIGHNISRNFPIVAEFVNADAAWSPNRFQAGQFPPFFREKIFITHDGVDVDEFSPNEKAEFNFSWLDLSDVEDIITYVGRGFEPLRGFPDFMRAVKSVQDEISTAHVVVIGDDKVAYGDQLPTGETWLQRMLDELDMDLTRVHFTGKLDYSDYRRVLQCSRAHVYLTKPFVLSWSFSEAMSVGCNIIASDVPAVREMAIDGVHAKLVAPGNIEELSNAIIDALRFPEEFLEQRMAARDRIVKSFNSEDIFSERLGMLEALISEGRTG